MLIRSTLPLDKFCSSFHAKVFFTFQITIVELLESMIAVWANTSEASVESLVFHGGETLLETIGNVMKAASRLASAETQTNQVGD